MIPINKEHPIVKKNKKNKEHPKERVTSVCT